MSQKPRCEKADRAGRACDARQSAVRVGLLIVGVAVLIIGDLSGGTSRAQTASEPVQDLAIHTTPEAVPAKPAQAEAPTANGASVMSEAPASRPRPALPSLNPSPPPRPASSFLSDRAMQLLVGSVLLALLPAVYHVWQHRTRSRRRTRRKDSTRRRSPSSVVDARLKARLGLDGRTGPLEKVPPRPRTPAEEGAAHLAMEKNPETPQSSTSEHLFATARAALDLLRKTPDDLKGPVIDQLGRLLDALQSEVEHLKRRSRHSS